MAPLARTNRGRVLFWEISNRGRFSDTAAARDNSCNFTTPIAIFELFGSLIAPCLFCGPKMEIRPGPLLPNADTINFDDEQLPTVMVHRGMHLQIRGQSGGEFRKNFCVVVYLQRDNSFVVLGWIVDDMGEVAVQGQQNGVDFLGLP